MLDRLVKLAKSFSQNLIKVKAKTTNEVKHIFKLKNRLFIEGKPIPFSLYRHKGNRWIKVHDKDTPFTESIEELEDIYMLEDDIPQFEDYLFNNYREISENRELNISEGVKKEVVYLSMSRSLESLLAGPTKEKVEKVKEYAEDLIDIVSSNNLNVLELTDLMSHDYYTYTHSINVAIYTILLYQNIDIIQNVAELKKVAQGAILHDIGKSFIPLEIVNKPGKLSDDEFKIMKEHPLKGVEYLKSIGENDKIILDIVGEHHEDFDGSGYPFGLKGEMISMYGKIAAIADVFDALTTKRSYKEEMTTFSAMELMIKMRHRFDPKYFKAFVKVMSPKGSIDGDFWHYVY